MYLPLHTSMEAEDNMSSVAELLELSRVPFSDE